MDTSLRHEFFVGLNPSMKIWLDMAYGMNNNFCILSMALNHLSEQIRKISRYDPWSVPPNSVLVSLVLCAPFSGMALTFCFWHIRQLHPCVKMMSHKHPLITQGDVIKHKELVAQPPQEPANP